MIITGEGTGDWTATAMPMPWPTPSPTPCSGRPGSATWAGTPPTPIRGGAGPTAWSSWPAWSTLARGPGWAPVNADCTVVAERPRLAPFVDRMSARLAAVLGAPVNVKATRAEGLGALGRAEGIACTAVALMTATTEAG